MVETSSVKMSLENLGTGGVKECSLYLQSTREGLIIALCFETQKGDDESGTRQRY